MALQLLYPFEQNDNAYTIYPKPPKQGFHMSPFDDPLRTNIPPPDPLCSAAFKIADDTDISNHNKSMKAQYILNSEPKTITEDIAVPYVIPDAVETFKYDDIANKDEGMTCGTKALIFFLVVVGVLCLIYFMTLK